MNGLLWHPWFNRLTTLHELREIRQRAGIVAPPARVECVREATAAEFLEASEGGGGVNSLTNPLTNPPDAA